MRRFFVQNIFFLLLVNLIVKPLWIFGIDRNVQLAVGHEAYGQYVALLNFSVIFQVLLDFGLQNYNNRIIAQSPSSMKRLFPNIIIAKAILSFGYFLLVIVLGRVLGYKGYALFLLTLLIFVQILNSFLLYLRSNVSGMHKFKTDSLLSVGDRLFMIVICGILLFNASFAAHFRIEWFVEAQIAAYLITSVVAFVVCTKITRLDWSHFDAAQVRAICVQSFPYALLIFLMAIYIRSDVFLMERLLTNGKEEAGIYAGAYRFLDVSNNVTGVLFAGILLPLFGRMLAKKEDIVPLLKLSTNILLPVALTAMFIAIFFGQDIMQLQLKNLATHDSGKVFGILMMAFPGYCIGYVYSTLLTANGSIKPLIVISLIAVVINIVSNLFLLPVYGAVGAAVSCVITQAFLSVANIFLTKKVIGLRTDIWWMLKYVLFAAVVCGLCFTVLKFEIKIWMQLLTVVAGAGITMLLCGFLPFHKLKELILNR